MTLSEKAARKGSSMKKHRRTFFVIENFDGIIKIAEILEWKGTSAIFLYEIAFVVLLKIKMKEMMYTDAQPSNYVMPYASYGISSFYTFPIKIQAFLNYTPDTVLDLSLIHI